MKIKVVDMTYEQALAQPPQVHKKPKKPSLLYRTVLRAASAPDLLATHFHCEKIGMEQIKSDDPCLVLMNHSCFLDLKIAEAVLYPRPFNIVCTSDGFVGKEWLMRSVGCIPTRKFCSDTTLVRDMLYCVRKLKTSILLYPEASYSFDGTATPSCAISAGESRYLSSADTSTVPRRRTQPRALQVPALPRRGENGGQRHITHLPKL